MAEIKVLDFMNNTLLDFDAKDVLIHKSFADHNYLYKRKPKTMYSEKLVAEAILITETNLNTE